MPGRVPDLQACGVGRHVVDDAQQVAGGQVGDEPDQDPQGGRHKQCLG